MGLIPAAAVFPLVIHATEMEGGGGGGGGAGEVDGDLSPSAGGLIPSGVAVLKIYQGGSGSNPGRANCSQEDSRWCDGPEEIQGRSQLESWESQLFPGRFQVV